MFMTRHERETMASVLDLDVDQVTATGGHLKLSVHIPDVTALSTEDLSFVLEMTEHITNVMRGESHRLIALDLEPAQQYEPAHARDIP
jgi:hypothetical protein